MTLAPVVLAVLSLQIVPPSSYSYDGGHRRDPFAAPRKPAFEATCESSAGCYPIDALELRGIVRTPAGRLAMVSSGAKSFLLRPGDALKDGTVKEIGEVHVTFIQVVNDPLAEKPFQDVTKSLVFLRVSER